MFFSHCYTRLLKTDGRTGDHVIVTLESLDARYSEVRTIVCHTSADGRSVFDRRSAMLLVACWRHLFQQLSSNLLCPASL
jgi:hypothetical protein